MSNLGPHLHSDAPRTAPLTPVRPQASRNERQWTLPGLCWNTSVMTSFGALPVQVLRKHDPLRLDDGAMARIDWFDKIQLDDGFLVAYPDAQPVLIRAGALGNGLPTQDMVLSPHQKLAVQGQNYNFELKLARDLIGRPGILRQPQTVLTYYLFHCGHPTRIVASGVALYFSP